jgi:hypothetical protein
MSEQPEKVEIAGTNASDPVHDGELADLERLRDGSRWRSTAQHGERTHHDLCAGHLAREGVARQDPLPPVAAQTDGQGDGDDPERRESIQLARHSAARQAWTWR